MDLLPVCMGIALKVFECLFSGDVELLGDHAGRFSLAAGSP
jgi:hypothetical protein